LAVLFPFRYAHGLRLILNCLFIPVKSIGSLDSVGGDFELLEEVPPCSVAFVVRQFELRHFILEVFADTVYYLGQNSALNEGL
jgi:hypothetical protein